MNVVQVIEQLADAGLRVRADDGLLKVRHPKPLTDIQLQYLKLHKTEILEYLLHLEAANQSKRYTYRFTLKNNAGGGTYITDCPLDEAENELIDMFIGRELESIVLLN